MNLPSIVIDDFFNDPHKVRQIGLQHSAGIYPDKFTGGVFRGLRSNDIGLLEPSLRDYVLLKICRSYFNSKLTVEDIKDVKYSSHFQLTDNTWGEGWVHSDSCLVTGILFLTPDADPEAGTNLFRGKKETTSVLHDHIKKHGNTAQEIRKSKEYLTAMEENNSQFYQTVSVKNVFNRSFTFDGSTFHAADHFFGETRETSRLTLTTFIYDFGQRLGTAHD
jgi:hypothetical protein